MQIPNLIKEEPVAVAFAVNAIILAAMAFGLHVSATQLSAINVAVAAILALITREQVSPVTAPPAA